ncbi:MAG: hypothetical protein ACLP8X_06820 [Streptosporangiaceae bacterium]
MPRSSLVRTHLAAAAGALALIATFLVSSAVTELIGTAGDVHIVRQWIVFGLPVLIGCLATAALSGRRLARNSRAAVIRRKERRMRIIAAAGIVVLVPCALILDDLTASASAGGVVTALEIAEILAGSLNLTLLVLNFRDGRGLTRPRRPARRPEMVDTGA